MLKTPVAFIIFNRPETTARVFAEIAKVQPPTLLVVADGPRPDKPGEAERCDAARKVIERVNWECRVLTNYSEINLGCKRRVSSGLDWVFKTVEEAIVLEDDCLPDPSFFAFCDELLEKYRKNERIMMISGFNFEGRTQCDGSYFFSRYPHIWGWASWRRAWRHYDAGMREWSKWQRSDAFNSLFKTENEKAFWSRTFDRVFRGEIDTWDAQVTYTTFRTGALSIFPNTNLISNIGFGEEATHTKHKPSFADVSVHPVSFPLQHPAVIVPHAQWDERRRKAEYMYPNVTRQAMKLITRIRARHVLHPLRSFQSLYRLGAAMLYRRFFKDPFADVPRRDQRRCWCSGELQPIAWHDRYGVCTQCGSYVNMHPPVKEALGRLYSLGEYWHARQKRKGHPPIEGRQANDRKDGRVAYWLDLIDRFSPTRGLVLEVGCGSGVLITELQRKGYKCIGVEPDARTAEWIRGKTGLDIRSGFFPEVDVPACDLFLAFDVIEHSPDPIGFMVGIGELLVPEGIAIIQTPIERYGYQPPFGERFGNAFDDVEHLFLLSDKAIGMLAAKAGLEVVNASERLALHHEVCVLRKMKRPSNSVKETMVSNEDASN
jgi:SAM-dependent methyltransferase